MASRTLTLYGTFTYVVEAEHWETERYLRWGFVPWRRKVRYIDKARLVSVGHPLPPFKAAPDA